MKTSTSTAADTPQQFQALWTWIKRRRLLVGAAAIVVLSLALGWNWLAAAGALPFLFASLPCALMMGMCMKGMGSNNASGSNSQNMQADGSADPASTDGPAGLPASSSSIASSSVKEINHE